MIDVTPAEPAHIDAIVVLAEDMDRFYGEPAVQPRDVRVRQINEAIFGDRPSAHALLAWDEGEPIAFAGYSFLWPAIGLTRSLYLKELYVCRASRRKGIGKLLMHELYQIALMHDCTRVEWTADRENSGAQRFYAELGVVVNESKLFYRVEANELARVTNGA